MQSSADYGHTKTAQCALRVSVQSVEVGHCTEEEDTAILSSISLPVQ